MAKNILFTIFVLGLSLTYGQNSPNAFPNGTHQTPLDIKQKINKSIIQTKRGEKVSIQMLKDGTSNITKIDLTEMVDIIIEMKDKPLFIQQLVTSVPVLQKSSYENRFMQFRSDLGILHQSSMRSLKTALGTPVIKREFHKIFFGAVVRVPRAMISQIASFNYVKKVHVDVKVKALLDHSVHQIHADSVWTKMGSQGDNVVVGIIDTGIDYLDTALGGGFGGGFKVIGGYDFVNNDADPIDDNGHGTHVAGIVAANSEALKGVAPHAKLMAFKVLDSGGWGTESQVLAGIERAADPNDDGNSNDMVNVVNMSLGGSGTPDDALSTAVDNAVKLGITFCIAAGNSYQNFTIGSPGTARLAITVGAVDQSDQIAYFSSKGPNPLIYSIKPEVVAPGVDILSTIPGNKTEKMSGTSMATPHVAGVCALLKSLHKNWSPAQIKSAVMATALDLKEEAMTQGAGRIDAFKAANVGTTVIPSSLNFGIAELTPTWTIAETLLVTNQSSITQTFTMSFDNLQSGISIEAVPSSFSLAQDNSQQVIITLSLNNSQVPYPTWPSISYSGNAYIYGTLDTLHIPWAFVKAAQVTITFDQPYANFVLASNSYSANNLSAIWTDSTHAVIITPEGTYDLFTCFLGGSGQFIIKENLPISNVTNLSISSAEAKYSLKLQGNNQNGQSISSAEHRESVYSFIFPDSSRFSSWIFSGFGDSLRVSKFSNRFTFTSGEFAFILPNCIYIINYDTLRGVNTNVTLTNRIEEFYSQNLKAVFPPKANYKEINFIFWSKFTFSNNYFYFGSPIIALTDFIGDWLGKLYLNREKDIRHSCTTSLEAYDASTNSSFSREPWFRSAPFAVVHDSVGMFFGVRPPASLYLSPNDGTVTLGKAPIYSDAYHYNNTYGSSNIAASPNFFGAMDERKYASPYRSYYSIYNKDNVVITSDTLSNIQPIDVPPGKYRFEVKNPDYFVKSLQGLATLTTRFDLRETDANPPQLSSFRLMNSNGLPTDSVAVGEHATLVFSSIDAEYIPNIFGYNDIKNNVVADSTKLYYRKYGTLQWNSLPVTLWMTDTADIIPRGLVFKADMTPATQFDTSAIDIKLIVQDKSGNSTEWALVPAFSVGAFTPKVAVEEVESISLSIPLTFALRQNYPNPFNPSTTIEFDIPRASFATLEIFNLLGQKVSTVAAKYLQAGTHRITWSASNLSSGIYFYKLSAGTFTNTKKLVLLK